MSSWLIQAGKEDKPEPGRAWEALRMEVALALPIFRLTFIRCHPAVTLERRENADANFCRLLSTREVCIIQVATVRMGLAERLMATSRMH